MSATVISCEITTRACVGCGQAYYGFCHPDNLCHACRPPAPTPTAFNAPPDRASDWGKAIHYCTEPECDAKSKARGLCQRHYDRWKWNHRPGRPPKAEHAAGRP